MPPQTALLAIDVGLTNIDAAFSIHDQPVRLTMAQRHGEPALDAVRRLIRAQPATPGLVAVAGGHTRALADQVDGVDVFKVGEIESIGRGGLMLSGLDAALVVSAGSGTAMVAARGREARHVTGSAVGGGTLLGLGKLLLGTADPLRIDALATEGDANQVDTTLIEAAGGAIGALPADANAVNFGRIGSANAAAPSRADLAAGLVRMVGQVIAVIAINAARAERLDRIVVVGRLAELPSIAAVFRAVAGYYGASIEVMRNAGFGTVLGALEIAREQSQ